MPPDGYEWIDGGPGMRLLDPQFCPGCGRFEFGERNGVARCWEHGTHLAWRCRCGQRIYRVPGAFVGELGCLNNPA